MVHFYFFPKKKPNYTDNSYFSESRDISYVLEKSDFFLNSLGTIKYFGQIQ